MSEICLISKGIPDLCPMQGRAKGVIHHSTVLSDLCVRLGHYEKGEFSVSRTQLGCSLEDSLAARYQKHFPDRYIYPGEMYIDDLPITPDLLDTSIYVPEEIKLSWMSSRHEPTSEKFQRFWWQVMSQCVALRTDRGRLNITHIMGDYKGFEVHSNLWEGRWTKGELDSHRVMILKHRDRMIREGYKGEGE